LIYRTLVQGQQIVVPLSISMGPKIRSFPRVADYANVGAFSVDRIKCIERVSLVVDARNYPFTIPHPVCGRIAEMRDVFVRALWVGLQNTGY